MATFVARTSASAIGAPEGSSTRPVSAPRGSCAAESSPETTAGEMNLSAVTSVTGVNNARCARWFSALEVGRNCFAHRASPSICPRVLEPNSRDHQDGVAAVAYTLLALRRSSTSVPAPGSLQTASLPPIRAARSGMPRNP